MSYRESPVQCATPVPVASTPFDVNVTPRQMYTLYDSPTEQFATALWKRGKKHGTRLLCTSHAFPESLATDVDIADTKRETLLFITSPEVHELSSPLQSVMNTKLHIPSRKLFSIQSINPYLRESMFKEILKIINYLDEHLYSTNPPVSCLHYLVSLSIMKEESITKLLLHKFKHTKRRDNGSTFQLHKYLDCHHFYPHDKSCQSTSVYIDGSRVIGTGAASRVVWCEINKTEKQMTDQWVAKLQFKEFYVSLKELYFSFIYQQRHGTLIEMSPSQPCSVLNSCEWWGPMQLIYCVTSGFSSVNNFQSPTPHSNENTELLSKQELLDLLNLYKEESVNNFNKVNLKTIQYNNNKHMNIANNQSKSEYQLRASCLLVPKPQNKYLTLLQLINIIHHIPHSIHINKQTISKGLISSQFDINADTLRRVVDEDIYLFITYQLLHLVQNLHQVGIIHGDVKPENFLIHPTETIHSASSNALHYSLKEKYFYHSSIQVTGLDFGRSLDLDYLHQDTYGTETFSGHCHVYEYQTFEMLLKKPWSYGIDLYGVFCILYLLLSGKYFNSYLKKHKKLLFKMNDTKQPFFNYHSIYSNIDQDALHFSYHFNPLKLSNILIYKNDASSIRNDEHRVDHNIIHHKQSYGLSHRRLRYFYFWVYLFNILQQFDYKCDEYVNNIKKRTDNNIVPQDFRRRQSTELCNLLKYQIQCILFCDSSRDHTYPTTLITTHKDSNTIENLSVKLHNLSLCLL